MGGFGSGTWYRYGTRPLAEHCMRLDISYLRKKDLLRPGLCYNLNWTNGSDITIKTFPEEIVLSYTIKYGEDNEESIRYPVFLEHTPCNFGGYRQWFLCPGRGCGRRVAKLYFYGRYFLCRHCHNLAYASQNEDKMDRLNRKMRKLRVKVGGDGDDVISPFPEKPKGMHWETFLRLKQKDLEANSKKILIMSSEISRLEAELGEAAGRPGRRRAVKDG